MQRSSENNRRWHAGFGLAALLGGVSLVGLLAAGTVVAKAEDSVTVKEINELKAQIKKLEKKVDSKTVTRQAAYPVTKGPYSPPMPWDKKFHLNGITITPGGFIDFGTWYHNHMEASDNATAFGSLPAGNVATYNTPETRLSARQSRVSMLIQGDINPSTKITGYAEADFEGTGESSLTYTNSFALRPRQLWIGVDWNDWGLHSEVGQMWTLVGMNGANGSLKPLTEVGPGGVGMASPGTGGVISTAGVVGQVGGGVRDPGIRISKDLPSNFTAAIAFEQNQTSGCPATPVGTTFNNNVVNPVYNVYEASTGGAVNCAFEQSLGANGNGAVTNQMTMTHLPDFTAKLAWDPMVAGRQVHLEAVGLLMDEYDEVSYQTPGGPAGIYGTTQKFDTLGWGAGGGLVVPIVPKLLDFQGSAMIGRGILRYGTTNINDAVLSQNGSLEALPEIMGYVGLTLHVTPAIDFYGMVGEERVMNAEFNGAATVNYSTPTANNSGCYIVGGTCAGATEYVWEATIGGWDTVYEGAFGKLRVGLQLEYVDRVLFSGTGSTSVAAYVGSPNFAYESIYASVRYFPFDAPPPAPALISKY